MLTKSRHKKKIMNKLLSFIVVILYFRDSLPPHVQSCVRCYTSAWKVVKYQNRSLSSSIGIRGQFSKSLQHSPHQEFEIDFQGLTSETASEIGLRNSFFKHNISLLFLIHLQMVLQFLVVVDRV